MAKFNSTVFPNLRNRVGNVVAYTAKGIDIVRSYNPKPADPMTPPQLRQREAMALIGDIWRNYSSIARNGMRGIPERYTFYNFFTQLNISNAINKTTIPSSVIYENLQFGYGTLTTPNVVTAPDENAPSFFLNMGSFFDYPDIRINDQFAILFFEPSTRSFYYFTVPIYDNGDILVNSSWEFLPSFNNTYIFVQFRNSTTGSPYTNTSPYRYFSKITRENKDFNKSRFKKDHGGIKISF